MLSSEALRGMKSQLEAVDGEENLTQLYSKALHDIGKYGLVYVKRPSENIGYQFLAKQCCLPVLMTSLR